MILVELFRERVLGQPPKRSIPPMDGAWRANDRLEECPRLSFDVEAPTGLAVGPGGELFVASDNRILVSRAPYSQAAEIASFAGSVRALAWHPQHRLIAAVSEEGVVLGADQAGRTVLVDTDQGRLRHPTGVAAAADGAIYVTEGSRAHPGEAWVRDLMSKGSSGRLVRFSVGSNTGVTLASDLAFPSAVSIGPEGAPIVSEAWRHRLIRLQAGRPEVVLDNLPGYPATLLRTGDTWWLALFAPRSHIVEFVLEEEKFRERMMKHIEPAFWISPSTDPREHHSQPVQVGMLRSQNIKKPWAPPRSYGLIVQLDGQFVAQKSFHSRSNGTRHGIAALAIADGKLFAASQGAHAILVPETVQE